MMHYIWVVLISLISLGIGAFFILKPSLAIDLQRKFYLLINWRMEPVSMPKEVRNTRIMGLLLIFIIILVIVLSFARCAFAMAGAVISNTLTVKEEFSVPHGQLLNAARETFKEMNLSFEETREGDKITLLKGRYDAESNFRVHIYETGDGTSGITIHIGTNISGKEKAQNLLELIRKNLK